MLARWQEAALAALAVLVVVGGPAAAAAAAAQVSAVAERAGTAVSVPTATLAMPARQQPEGPADLATILAATAPTAAR